MIAECLECLSTQTHHDFTVLISDNASTDGTSDVWVGNIANPVNGRAVLVNLY